MEILAIFKFFAFLAALSTPYVLLYNYRDVNNLCILMRQPPFLCGWFFVESADVGHLISIDAGKTDE